jgi:hypothetical protein
MGMERWRTETGWAGLSGLTGLGDRGRGRGRAEAEAGQRQKQGRGRGSGSGSGSGELDGGASRSSGSPSAPATACARVKAQAPRQATGQYRAIPIPIPTPIPIPDKAAAAAAAGAEAVRHEPAQASPNHHMPAPTQAPDLTSPHPQRIAPAALDQPSQATARGPLLPSFENPQSDNSTVVTSAAVGQQPPLAAGTAAPECAFPMTCPYPKPLPIFVSQHGTTRHDTTRHDTTQC